MILSKNVRDVRIEASYDQNLSKFDQQGLLKKPNKRFSKKKNGESS